MTGFNMSTASFQDSQRCYCPVPRPAKSGHKCPILPQAGILAHHFQPSQHPQVPHRLRALVDAANYASIWRQPHLARALKHAALPVKHLPVDDLQDHMMTHHHIGQAVLLSTYEQVVSPEELGCCRWCQSGALSPSTCVLCLRSTTEWKRRTGCSGRPLGPTPFEEGQAGGGP